MTVKPWFPYRLTGAIIDSQRKHAGKPPWFPYRLTGAIIEEHQDDQLNQPWFPYRLTGAIIVAVGSRDNNRPWFPYRLTGAIIEYYSDRVRRTPWFPYRLTGAIIRQVGSQLGGDACRRKPRTRWDCVGFHFRVARDGWRIWHLFGHNMIICSVPSSSSGARVPTSVFMRAYCMSVTCSDLTDPSFGSFLSRRPTCLLTAS